MPQAKIARRFAASLPLCALFVAFLPSPAEAVLVQIDYGLLNGGRADFGGGNHSFGVPGANAIISFDYSYNQNHAITVKARVKGILYWDSLTSSGCARLTIRYKTAFAQEIVNSVQRVDHCGPGGDANSAANQKAVDITFTNPGVVIVEISANELVNGKEVEGDTAFASRPGHRTFPFKIDSGTADLGSGGHSFGAPNGNASVKMSVVSAATMQSEVTGTLYWDALVASGCARVLVEFRTEAGTTLDDLQREKCGPGGNANDASNQRSIALSRADADAGVDFWTTRVRVGTVVNTSFVGVTSKSFDFNGPIGVFDLAPTEATAAVNKPLRYTYTWTVPEPGTWHDLHTLLFRVRDETETVLLLRWEEATNAFSVFNDASGKFGRSFPAGSPARLQTDAATVHLANTTAGVLNSALGSGPASPAVRLKLSVSFKPWLAGRTFKVDVAATDDQGREDPFVEAGSLTVTF